MKRFLLSIVISAFVAVSFATDVKGYWKGEVMSLPIVFHVFEKEGGLAATLDSPAQGAKDIPCESIVVSGDSVKINMPLLSASFSGVIESDGGSIRGIFTQGINVPLVLTRATAEASVLYRPQEPKPPFVYNRREVEFTHDGITLAGMLTTPMWGKNFPAVVLISGSGAQNRDEEIMGHKPFAVIADYLTRSGIAVLRYDDRGVGGSTPGTADDTTFDFAQDVCAAVDFLKTCAEIDSSRIGLLGHSEGGTIAFIVTSQRPGDVSFVVSLAGMLVKGKELMKSQNRMFAELAGQPLTAEMEETVSAIFEAIDTIDDVDALQDRLRSLMAGLHEPDEVEASVKQMTSPWYMSFVRLDPARYISTVKCPVLALNGEWDVQVEADMNLRSVKSLLPGCETKSYAQMNHLFQELQSKSQSFSYGSISQTISPTVLNDVASWIVKTVKR